MDNTKNAVQIFDKYAELYQEKYMDISLYHESLDLFCQQISKENPEILELGCGPGNITQYVLKKRPDFKILGTDLAPNMLDLARKNNPGATFQMLDCRDIGRLTKRYDGIICGFCLPYLSKEESLALIRDAAERLNPGGLLYISTMEDDYQKSGLQTSSQGDQLYMYFHQADYLSEALMQNGFEIIDIQRCRYPGKEGEVTTDLMMLGRIER